MTQAPDELPEPTTDELEMMSSILRDPALWAEPSAEVEDRVLAAIAAEMEQDPEINLHRDVDLRETMEPPPADVRGAAPLRAVDGAAYPPPRVVPPTPEPPARHEPDRADQGEQGQQGEVEGWSRPIELDQRRGGRRYLLPLGIAAGLLILALGSLAAFRLIDADSPSSEAAIANLTGADYAPEATAVATVDELPNGARIVLDTTDLPPAPEGFIYAAWVIREEPRNRVGIGTFHMRGGDGEIELWSGVTTEVYSTISVTLQPEDDPTGPGELVLRGTIER